MEKSPAFVFSTTEELAHPKLRRLRSNYFVAHFEVMKLIPSIKIIEQAERAGELAPGSKVIESSSGTFALGLALVCAEKGYPLVIIGDNSIDETLGNRLLDLGTKLDIVDGFDRPGGIQQARLDRLHQYMQMDERFYWPSQYTNPNNPASYEKVANFIKETIGLPDILVASVGSGGSSCGLSYFLRKYKKNLTLVGVDSNKSVIFGKKDGFRMLRGLGSSIIPANIDHTAFDEVHWVTCAEGFAGMRRLHQNDQMFMGPTSGAVDLVAHWVAKNQPNSKVLGVFPDSGHRYALSAYSDAWLKKNKVFNLSLPDEPKLSNDINEPAYLWTRFLWGKRAFSEVASGY